MSFEPSVDVDRLRTIDGIKWSKYGDDVIPAWVADMDLRPPPVAIDAMQRVIDRCDFGYNHAARDALAVEFARWQHESHGWEVDPSECVLFNDVLHAIEYTLWHRTDEGDGVVLFTPIYPPFLSALRKSRRRFVDCPLTHGDGGWSLEPDVLRRSIDDGTRVILLCNPHNPTGHVFAEAELDAIGEVAAEHDLLVIADEVWGDLVYDGSVHRPAPTTAAAARAVTISAASKSFNLAGLRSAVAHLGDPDVRTSFLDHPHHLRGAVNTIGAEAAVACWRHARPWLDQLRRHLRDQRDHLDRRVAADLPGITWSRPEATYLAWLDLSSLDLGPDPAAAVLDRTGVALSSGATFGPGGDGHVRLNFATDRAVLDEIIDRLATLTA